MKYCGLYTLIYTLLFAPGLAFGQLVVQQSSFSNTSLNSTANLAVQSISLPNIAGVNSGALALQPLLFQPVAAAPQMASKSYFYPTPFQQQSGSTLWYLLSADMPIQIRFYNDRGYEINRLDFSAGDNPGGRSGGNSVPIDDTALGYSQLSAGLYFYLILNNGNVIDRGRFAILP